MGIDRAKVKTMDKLKDKGFDTAAKIKTLDGREILKYGLTGEMANIFALQDAIKANHSEIAWMMDGEDPKPDNREVKRDADDDRSDGRTDGIGIYTEAYDSAGHSGY